MGLRRVHGCPGLTAAARCGPFGVACRGLVVKSELSRDGCATETTMTRDRHHGGVLERVGGGNFVGSVVLGDHQLS